MQKETGAGGEAKGEPLEHASSLSIEENRESHANPVVTPERLTLVALDQHQIDTVADSVPYGLGNVQDIYPLSPLQEGMLFHRLLNDASDPYILSTLFEAVSRAGIEQLAAALQRVIDRHDILRSAVLRQNMPRPVQVVCRRARLKIRDVALNPERDTMAQLKELMRPGTQAFDLGDAPLAVLLVANDAPTDKWYAVLVVHHLICDHQSLNLMVREALAFLNAREDDLLAPIPYRSYVSDALSHTRSEEAEAFFRSMLGAVAEPTAPFGLLDVHGDGSQVEEASQEIESSVALQVRAQARRAGVSAARLFHAAWSLVVAYASAREDVVFGTVVMAAQQRNKAQRVLGMSVNTLPLRLRLQEVSVEELIQQTHRELANLVKYEHVPLTISQSFSGVAAGTPLFTSILNYRHSVPDAESQTASEAGVRVLSRGEAWTNYPITVLVDDLGENFTITAQTDRRIDPHRLIGYLRTALESIVSALQGSARMPAMSLSILPEAERKLIVEGFNATRQEYPENALIHELFEQQVELTPDSLAVVHEGQTLTYAELNSKANQLARALRERGVGSEQLVALCVERGLEMVIGLLGILKSGGAYVPLDPSYPTERLAHILTHAAPRVLLTDHSVMTSLSPVAKAIGMDVVLVDKSSSDIAQRDDTNLAPRSDQGRSRTVAYVIHTSGSTGTPKGVMVEHRAAVNFLSSMRRRPGLSADDRLLAVTTIAFDIAALEIFLPLLTGARLVLASQRVATDPASLAAILEAEDISVLQATPATYQMLLGNGWAGRPGLKLLCGGEALPADLAAGLLRRCSSLWNMYGPTETTIWSCVQNVVADEVRNTVVSVGRPIANTQIYILDSERRVVPIGVAGEIYIGGIGVARGYLKRQDLTAERFTRDPFSVDVDARIYRTGDLGRWNANGTIAYLGRNDHQVKIRGFRIELGEIEAHLARHTQVKEAVVVAREESPGQKRLVAYIVQRDGTTSVSADELRSHIKGVLPEYMVPSAFVTLTQMPLTPNGKLDRRALPAPDLGAYAARHYEPPRGEVEEAVTLIWQDILNVSQVGRLDNFFDLGGHSLLAMQAAAHLQALFGIEIPIRTLFDSPTVQELSAQIESFVEASASELLAEGGTHLEELLDRVTAMSETNAQDLLRKSEGRA